MIRDNCLLSSTGVKLEARFKALGLTVTETAKRLGVTRQALNNLVNGKGGILAEMAVRLSKAFGSSPEVWLGMQMEYDLAQVEKEARNIKVKRVA